MKVAVVVRSLKIGGMERVAISLTKAFQDGGHDSHLIYFKKKKEHYSTDGINNLHFFNFDTFLIKTVFGIIYELLIRVLNIFFRKSYPITKGFVTSFIFKHKLKKLEKEKAFDLIIIRGQGTFEFLWFNQDNRYVQVCENLLYPNKKVQNLQKFYAKLLYSNKNIACVSNGVLESFNDLTKKANLTIKKAIKITNPIDIDGIKILSKEYVPNIDAQYIVNVGRLAPVKQLPLLIDAYLYIKNRYNIKHKLVLVGQGHDEKNIKHKIEKLQLQNDVLMIGVETNPYPWIANAQLFVLSSKHEGLGMVLLEALACKTNLVVTKSTGGVNDIMKDELKQFLCEQNAESLGEKIYSELTHKSYIDFDKHLYPFLPTTITNRYIDQFI
jgi:glycosyltransferase involved in cell wall biosynthesis